MLIAQQLYEAMPDDVKNFQPPTKKAKKTAPEPELRSAEEHAVSTLAHGPCKPSTKDTRPAAADTLSPVTAYTDARVEGG